jgi:KaiC/GvpD/RAD55 family RecA-like ATPase|tara:strand:+ start:750 stop:971 length:222 start_codon:yes stop_codon:yes gene_type:complete
MLLNSKKFGLIIEKIVKEKRITYMDAVLNYCEDNNLDSGSINTLINKSLKEKIQIEAEKLNLIEKTNSAKLPL